MRPGVRNKFVTSNCMARDVTSAAVRCETVENKGDKRKKGIKGRKPRDVLLFDKIRKRHQVLKKIAKKQNVPLWSSYRPL
jgi:hypothetical protein